MKNCSKMNHIIIRKRFYLSGCLTLVLILSLFLGGGFLHARQVQAAEVENPLFKMSLEEYLQTSVNNSYTWDNYSNEDKRTRAERLSAFANYYSSQIDSKVAESYGIPSLTRYDNTEYNVLHNLTAANSNYDLFLMEFSTGNNITNPNLDIFYSVYFIEQSSDSNIMRFTTPISLSNASKSFLERTQSFRQGQLEMTTVQLPKGSVPVGVYFWQAPEASNLCAWDLDYFNVYKIDSISDITRGSQAEDNYRTFTGTRVGYIDSDSINKKYMASIDGGANLAEGKYLEWLYPLTPEKEEMAGYVVEIVAQGSPIIFDTSLRDPSVTLHYVLNNGKTESTKINTASEYSSTHPFVNPEDYDSNYDFVYEYVFSNGANYVNPIAQNNYRDTFLFATSGLNKYLEHNQYHVAHYDLSKEEFWKLPESRYYFTEMNQFSALMLGNYFDAYTMKYSYLKEYKAIQIPVTLPGNINKFTEISIAPGRDNSLASKAGIQSIRVIQLSEPLASDFSTNLTSNGFLSSEPVIPLRGTVIAKTNGKINGYTQIWKEDNPVYSITNYKTNKGVKIDTVTNKFQGVTITFSDTFGAGFDHLLADVKTAFASINSYQYPADQTMIYVFKDKKNPDNLGLPLYNLLEAYRHDPFTLTVSYYDTFGDIREVDIPFVTAYLAQLIMDARHIGDTDPETWISGVFQQGQTVGLRLNLSEFKSLISVKLHYGYGGSNVLEGKVHSMYGDAWYDPDDKEQAPLKYDLSKDSIALKSICFYDNVTPGNFTAKYDGKSLTSTIETSLEPSCCWQSSTADGQIITENRSFTAYRESRGGSDVNMFSGGPIKEEYKDKYLVEITTLNTEIAGTVSNLSYQLHYKDLYGTSRSTTIGALSGVSKDYYGNSSRNLDTFATDFQSKVQYVMHLTPGSKFCFVVEIPDLYQFEGITLMTDGLDEWQPEQVRILKLKSLSERNATRDTAFIGNLSAMDIPDNMKNAVAKNLGVSTYRWDRTYTGTVLASAAPNLLLHSGKTSARINFTIHNTDGTTTPPDAVMEEIQYMEKIPNSMTYEDTLMDLGLNVVKNTYQINVDVANVGDAGSSNYFYFQLLFENGRSGLVLANQQLPSDSFRQGVTETFEIQTTQRYGEVKAVRIICEATASTANTFDKLNIDKITVTLNSKQGTGKSWIVDRVGWIDINYVDEIQQSYATDDNVILDNKDLTLDFPITSISSSAELMFCITNGKQSNTSNTLNLTSLGSQIEGIITYTDFQDATRSININIPQKIMDFNENESTSRILRSGTMDRFIVTLPDVKHIDSLVITRNEGKNGDWLISNISVQKVGGVGNVYLSSYTSEYIRDIEYSDYLTELTTQNIRIGTNDSKTFYFEPHVIEADISSEDNNAWNTTITRYPVSSDESLNLYVYLVNTNGEPYKLSDGDYVDASVVYSSSMGTGALKASFKNIRAQSATDTSSVLFAQGLSIQSVGNLKSIELRGSFANSQKPLVRCVYIEHVQGNVIKDTLYVPFNNASMSLDRVSASISTLEALTPMKQVVRLQPKESTSAILTPESSDIAVALRYTSSLDPETTKMVYQSPYVFLTDVDYTALNNRDHIEVPFYISGVGEIVGLTVVSSGPAVNFENALITNHPRSTAKEGEETTVTTLLGSCSIAESFVSTNIISKMMKTSKSVTPVTFTFTTPKEELVAGCGTSGQVGMLITYTDTSNKQQTYRIMNILDYLPLDNPPFSDTVTSFNILMTDVSYLNSVTLTPATDDWFLAEVNAKVTTYDGAKQTTVNKTAVVNQWAKADKPLSIDMRPDSVNTDGPVINKITGFSLSASAQQSKASAFATSGNPLNIKVVAGDLISFTPTFQKVGNPTANINWSAYKYEKFFTDYSNGSATFVVPSEETILNEGLPRQYTLSAVCSENNSLAISITIDVVSPEDLQAAKESTAKLTIMTHKNGKTISTQTYHESDKFSLEIPVDASGTTSEETIFKFTTSLNKTNALFNVNNNQGLISLGNDGAYTLTIPAGVTRDTVSNYYLMFNVADSETETTYSITASVALIEESTPAETMTVTLTSDGQTLGTTDFEETSLSNRITYNGDTSISSIAYRLSLGSGSSGATYSITPIESSYADEALGTTTEITGSSGSLFTVPTLEQLEAALGDDGTLPNSTNGTILVPFHFKVNVSIPQTASSAAKSISGEIRITISYTVNAGTLESPSEEIPEPSDTDDNFTDTIPDSAENNTNGASDPGSSGISSEGSSTLNNSENSSTADIISSGSEDSSTSNNSSDASQTNPNSTDNGLPSAGVGSI